MFGWLAWLLGLEPLKQHPPQPPPVQHTRFKSLTDGWPEGLQLRKYP
jgi:hypothetical protein